MKKIYSLLLLGGLLFFGVESMFAACDFVGHSAINVNGSWYYAGTSSMTWCEGGAFNGTNLGCIAGTSFSLGGQSQTWETGNKNWGSGTVTMYYKIDDGDWGTINLDYYGFANNNNLFESREAGAYKGKTIDISGLTNGSHTIAVYFKCGDQYDSNNSNNYIATFYKGIHIGSSTWATFSCESEVAIPTGVTAYYASDINSSTNVVTLTKITGGYIPAGEGVVVHGDEGNYTATITSTSASLATNYLQANTTAKILANNDGTNYNYTLAVDGGNNPIFKHSSGSGVLAASKAYLKTTINVPAPEAPAIIRDENNATSIDAIDASEEAVKFFQNGKLYIKKNGVVYDMVGAIVK